MQHLLMIIFSLTSLVPNSELFHEFTSTHKAAVSDFVAHTKCPDCNGTGICPLCKGHPYSGTVLVDCTNCSSWNDEYKRKVACHVCKDTRQMKVKGCYGCTVILIFGNPHKIAGKCNRCNGTGKVLENESNSAASPTVNNEAKNSQTNNNKKKTHKEGNEDAGLSENWPLRDYLFLGLRKNVYVKQLKRVLGLPETEMNGDYDKNLKDAVAFYIKTNDVEGVKQDGSVVPYKLYLQILNVDGDGNSLESKQQKVAASANNSNTEKPNNTTNTNMPQQPRSSEHLRVSGNIFPVFLNEPASPDSDYAVKVRYYIGQLQRCVNAKQTGRVNQETIDKVRSFLTNPKIKPQLVNPMDSESSELLNGNPPGITASLYNIIVHTRDRITIRNSEAKTPADVIN